MRELTKHISVWRPIGNAVEDWPLAVMDASSISRADLAENDFVRKKFVGENLFAHFSSEQKWYYLGQHQPEEVMLMKMFDSDETVKASSKCLEPRVPSSPTDSNYRLPPCFIPPSWVDVKLEASEEHRSSRIGLELSYRGNPRGK